MTKDQRNLLILFGVILVVILLGIWGFIDFNQHLQASHDAFAAGLAGEQRQTDLKMTAVYYR